MLGAMEQAIFFVYVGMTFAVSLVAILWGSPSKVTGASFLLASVLISNIIDRLYRLEYFGIQDLAAIYVFVDLCLIAVFMEIMLRSNGLNRNRWAGVVAALHGIMCLVNVAAVLFYDFASTTHYRLALNLLFIAVLLVCLIGFLPKSWEEAKGVLIMKWRYFRSDLFRRVALLAMDRNKGGAVSAIDSHIGLRIRQARITRGLTREALADALEVSTAQIQRYESGANRISASALFTLARHLGVEISFFYAEAEPRLRLIPEPPDRS